MRRVYLHYPLARIQVGGLAILAAPSEPLRGFSLGRA